MRVFESALLLVAGSVLLTFAGVSFGLFPRPVTPTNPSLLVEALGVAGLVLFGLGCRGLYRIHRALGNSGRPDASCPASA